MNLFNLYNKYDKKKFKKEIVCLCMYPFTLYSPGSIVFILRNNDAGLNLANEKEHSKERKFKTHFLSRFF